MLKKTITRLLSVPDAKIFDGCVEAIEIEYGRPVTNLCDLKKREDKKKKGDLWECFCRDWLLASDKYKNVWLFQEWMNYCSEKQISTKGLKTKQDNGIDIIVELNNGKYGAIQCKYRKDMKKVTWNTLSTFIGLCERTGPWEQYIVMTNGKGVTRKVPMSKKDKSICVGTFRRTHREQWLKMVGLYQENIIKDDKQEIPTDSELQGTIQVLMNKYAKPRETTVKTHNPSIEELREIRVKKFIQDKIEL